MTPRRLLLFAAGLALALALNAAASDFFIDDAYISFHYADNLARHGSLYYNQGEHGPVGYTNPLYIFLLASCRLATAGMVADETIARALGCLALAVIAAVLLGAALDRRGRDRALAAGLALLFLLLFPELLPNFYSGLETGLFTLCLFAMILSLEARTPRQEICFLAALAAALGLRLDSGLLVSPLGAIYLWNAVRQPARGWRLARLAAAGLAAAAVYLVHVALAGLQVPLSFYQKSAAFSLRTLWSYEAFCLLVVAPLLVLTWRRTERVLSVLALVYPLCVSAFYSFFMPWMFRRYVFPAAFAFSAALLLSFLKLDLRGRRREIAFLALYCLIAFPAGLLEGFSWVSGYRVSLLNTRRVAEAMNAAGLPAQHRLLATPDAGFIPYRTGWRLLDLLGLTTPEVRHEGATGAIRRLAPTVLILSGPNASRPEELTLVSRYGQPAAPIPDGYRFVKHLPLSNRYWWPEVDYGYFIFVNGNADPRLVSRLESISVDVEQEMGWQGAVYRLLRNLAVLGKGGLS